MTGGPYERILISHVAGIGRTVLALPALSALRHAYPRSHITIACSFRGAELVKLSQYADAVFPVSRLTEAASPRAALSALRSLRALNQEHFDAIIEFPGQSGSIVASLAASSGTSKGGGVFSGIKELLLGKRGKQRHLSQVYLDKVAELGAYPVDNQPKLLTDPEADRRFEKKMDKARWHDGSIMIGIAIRDYSAQGGLERWAGNLSSTLSARLILLPARFEKSMAKRVVKGLDDNYQLVAPIRSMVDLTSTLARLSLLITERSGLAHLAGALGTPVLLLRQVKPEERPLATNQQILPVGSDPGLIIEQAARLIKTSRSEYLSSR